MTNTSIILWMYDLVLDYDMILTKNEIFEYLNSYLLEGYSIDDAKKYVEEKIELLAKGFVMSTLL